MPRLHTAAIHRARSLFHARSHSIALSASSPLSRVGPLAMPHTFAISNRHPRSTPWTHSAHSSNHW
ncbi:hypothetical protein K438DRAFT_202809 [Mycena galopus ATCC 62051]|nr:hypothetical protein K438DRAFT_202809 [Mycena galopus ATCC 62051]